MSLGKIEYALSFSGNRHKRTRTRVPQLPVKCSFRVCETKPKSKTTIIIITSHIPETNRFLRTKQRYLLGMMKKDHFDPLLLRSYHRYCCCCYRHQSCFLLFRSQNFPSSIPLMNSFFFSSLSHRSLIRNKHPSCNSQSKIHTTATQPLIQNPNSQNSLREKKKPQSNTNSKNLSQPSIAPFTYSLSPSLAFSVSLYLFLFFSSQLINGRSTRTTVGGEDLTIEWVKTAYNHFNRGQILNRSPKPEFTGPPALSNRLQPVNTFHC